VLLKGIDNERRSALVVLKEVFEFSFEFF